MNFLDIILIIINIILLLIGIITIIVAIIKRNDCWSSAPVIAKMYWITYLSLGWLCITPFIVLDRGSGSTVGTITSVDKNFFGTTALYIKTSETEQEEYCIENKNISNQAKELIDKKVKVSYGERIGIYSTGKCSQAPIEKIEVIESR